ncbi:TPA: hypothetical protein EYQ19_02020 [Candidatus Pacearchaeota archaeon]|nr:hypothetical protein [Candidatus Pacearchaeota archaeon]
MEKRELNKKGQNLTIGAVILIVLGVVVLVMLVIGFTKGWSFLFGKFDVLPGSDLETIAQACKIAGEANLMIDFCAFKKLNDGNWVNCEDDRFDKTLDGADSGITCDKKWDDFCKDEVSAAGKEVNSNKCLTAAEAGKDTTCEGKGGTWKENCQGAPLQEIESDITVDVSDTPPNNGDKKCCVAAPPTTG